MEIIEKKQGKIEDDLAVQFLRRVKRLETDLKALGMSDAKNVRAIECLISDDETHERKLSICESCSKYSKQLLRSDFDIDLKAYRELKESGEIEAARKSLIELRRKYGAFSEAWMEIGTMYSEEDDMENALACYRVADEQGDLGFVPLCFIGLTLCEMEKYDEAVPVLEKAIIKYTPTRRCQVFYHSLGQIYRKIGSTDDIERISKFIDDPEDPQEPNRVKAYLFFLMEEFSKARQELTQVDLGESSEARLLNAAMSESDDYESAKKVIIDTLREAEADFLVFDVLLHLSENDFFKGDCQNLKELVTIMSQWLEQETQCDTIAAFLDGYLVEAYHGDCKYDDFAIDLLQKAKAYTNSYHIDHALLPFLMRINKPEDALQIARERNHPRIWYSLGELRCEADHEEDAIDCFEKSIALDPKEKSTWDCLITCYGFLDRQKEHQDAVNRAKQALGLESDEAVFVTCSKSRKGRD